MTTPRESRAALKLLTGEAVATAVDLMARVRGSAEIRRAALLDGVPDLIGYYSEGSAALAVDFYEEQRELAGITKPFVPELVIADRVVKIRRGIAWASGPLFDGLDEDAGKRLAEVVQIETARPYRDSILSNQNRDPAAVGWRRVTAGGCKMCRMLADKGAIFKESTATFATHPGCNCSAQPVFGVDDFGEEASVMQYVASQSKRSPAQQKALREYLDAFH